MYALLSLWLIFMRQDSADLPIASTDINLYRRQVDRAVATGPIAGAPPDTNQVSIQSRHLPIKLFD
jgi:hypothetical protein